MSSPFWTELQNLVILSNIWETFNQDYKFGFGLFLFCVWWPLTVVKTQVWDKMADKSKYFLKHGVEKNLEAQSFLFRSFKFWLRTVSFQNLVILFRFVPLTSLKFRISDRFVGNFYLLPCWDRNASYPGKWVIFGKRPNSWTYWPPIPIDRTNDY